MLEDDLWECVLKPYAADPGNAFVLAQTFCLLRQTLNKRPDGVQEVMLALDNGIKELYSYTDVHHASFVLYQRLVSDEGLKPYLDPREIMRHLT